MGFGTNTLAARVTRASRELCDLCIAMGGNPKTIDGRFPELVTWCWRAFRRKVVINEVDKDSFGENSIYIWHWKRLYCRGRTDGGCCYNICRHVWTGVTIVSSRVRPYSGEHRRPWGTSISHGATSVARNVESTHGLHESIVIWVFHNWWTKRS